jgi:hypothetical protein
MAHVWYAGIRFLRLATDAERAIARNILKEVIDRP